MRYLFLLLACVACQARQDARPAPKPSAASAPALPQTTPQAALPKTESASLPAREELKTKRGTLKELLAINPEIISSWKVAAEAKLIFALHVLGPGDLNPVIFRKEASGWSAISFHDDFHGHAWQDAIFVPKTKTIVSILDFEVESPGQQLEIFTSQDNGETWHQATIEKPYYLARFLEIEAFADGALRLSVTLEDDFGSGNKPGLYQYMSRDSGATWSAPTHTATLPSKTRKGALSTNIKSDGDLDILAP